MEQINLYNTKKKQLLQSIQQASGIMKELNMSKEYGLCSELYKKLREDTFKVVVMGRFKVGKSTFINALLGSGDVLPAQATPCTAVINEVKYSKERYAIIHFKHPIPSPLPRLAPNIKKYIEGFKGKRVSPIKVDAKYLNQFVVIDDEAENQKDGVAQTPFSKAEIYWDLPICEQGVEIIDTPGLDENMSRTDVTKNYLSQADAIIFVMDCTAPCALSEMQSIDNDVLKAGHEYIIFVCNKINIVKEKERESIKQHMNKMLQSKTKLGVKGIYYLNAEEAKDGSAENDQEKYIHSGMAAFEAELDEVLAKKRGTIKLLQPARQIKTAIEYAIATAIPNERKMLESSTQEINQRLQRELPNLERLRQEKELIASQIENEISKICRDVDLMLQHRYNDIVTSLPEWVNGISCANSVSWNPFKVKESIRVFSEELIENLQHKLTSEQEQWQESELQPFVTNRFQVMAQKFQATITRIFVDIEKIKLRIAGVDDSQVAGSGERIAALVAGFFGGGITGAAVGGTLGFSKEFIATIVAQIALGVILGSIIGATNPFTLVAVIVAGLIGMGAGLTKIEEKIRKKISEQVTDQLRNDRDESIRKAIGIIRQNLEKGSSDLSGAIDNELQSVEDLVNQIRRDKQMGEQQVRERIAKLEQNQTTFQGLLTNIKAFIKNMEEKDIDFTPVPDGNPVPEETPRHEEPAVPTQQPQVPQPPQEPHDDSSLVSCTNPQCPNYGKKVLPSTTKFCPECGAKINVGGLPPEPPKPEPSYFIDPDKDVCEIDGITYYRINALCPNCIEEGINQEPTHWKHSNDNCGGDLYIGNDGNFMCGKCGAKKPASYWRPLCSRHDGVSCNSMICESQQIGTSHAVSLASQMMASTAGIDWFQDFISNIRKAK